MSQNNKNNLLGAPDIGVLEKGFEIQTVTNMFKTIIEKVQKKDEKMENFIRELQSLKKQMKILELKNITVIKNIIQV